MDPNNSTACAKTIKDHFSQAQHLHHRELSRKILCKIPGLRMENLHEKRTCKDEPGRLAKRGEEQGRATGGSRARDQSSSKLKHFLSEKNIEPRPPNSKAQPAKKQVYVALLDNAHFVNAKYNKGGEREKPDRQGMRGHQRHKSNMSLSKQQGLKAETHGKNNSLVLSLLAKNLQGHRREEGGGLKDGGNRDGTRQILVQRKKGSSTKFSKVKDKSTIRETELELLEVDVTDKLPFYSNNNSPAQHSAKKVAVDSRDGNCLKKYFFNIQAIRKNKKDGKSQSLVESQKQFHRGFSAALKPTISNRKVQHQRQSSRDVNVVANDDTLPDHPALFSDNKRTAAPKFNEVLRNVFRDKETKDVKNLRNVIQDYVKEQNKVPETSLHFYQIIKLLGKGSFGKVYLGLQRLTNRLVAIKCLEKTHFKDESTKRKILSEVKILKRLLGHPNVVKLLEVFENKKYVFFVTEYATNGDLLKHAKSGGAIPELEARHMFFQIAMGLRYIHSQNIIHRDVKLDNILLDESNRCKICDFGVSRQIDPEELINEQCGTPAYLAPEIIRDQGYRGFGADIWSLGVLLFCLLTGHMPFKASTIEDLHKKILDGKYEIPAECKLSPEAIHLVAQMLVLDPRDRISIEGVVRHDWLKSLDLETTTIRNARDFEKRQNNYLTEYVHEVNDFALHHVTELGFPKELVEKSINNRELNHASACYFNLEKDFV